MADIVQTLGFEATGAISQINQLKASLDNLNKSFAAAGAGVKGFNGLSGGFTKALGAIQAGVNKTLQSLNQLNNIKIGSGGAFNAGQVASQFDQIRQNVAQTWGQLPATVSSASRASYQAAVGALTKFAATNKISSQQMLTAFAGLAGGSPVLNQLQQKVTGLGTAWQNAMNTIQSSSQRAMFSMASLARFAGFYTLMRVLTTLVSGFQEGTTAAIEFGKRLGEIGTISGGGNLQEITARVANFRQELIAVSQATGRGLADVGLAYYETLSNQVGDAAQSMAVFRESAELAVVTNTSLTDSTNLMTAAINAWGLGAEQAAEVSATLFRAIELGRFRANELANILGRVGPVAREMGIGLDEAMSALTVMSIQGTRADTAVTQLRATMTGLLKPSEALKAVFQNMYGVDNAEQAILVAGGYGNLLVDLRKQAGMTASELAELFKNVRAISGVAGMTGTKSMAADLEKLRETTAKTFDEMYKFVQEQPAQKAAVAFNNLKVSMEEMANSAIPAITKLANTFTYVVNNLGKLLAATLAGAAAFVMQYIPALIAMAAAALKAAAANGVLALTTPAGWALLAAAGIADLTLYLLENAKAAEKAAAAQAKLRDERVKNIMEGNAATSRAQTQLRDAQATEMARFFSQQSLMSKGLLDGLRERNAAQVAMMKAYTSRLLDSHTDLLSKMRDADQRYADTAKDAAANRWDIQRTKAEDYFSWQLGRLGDEAQASAHTAKAAELAAEAQGILSKASRGEVLTDEELRKAKELLNLSLQHGKAAEQVGLAVKDTAAAEYLVTRAREGILKTYAAQEKYEQVRALSAKNAADGIKKEMQIQEEANQIIAEKIRLINEGTSAYKKQDDVYVLKTPAELKAGTDAGLAAAKSLSDMVHDPRMVKSLSNLVGLGLGEAVQTLERNLNSLQPVAVKLRDDYLEFKERVEAQSKSLPIHITTLMSRQTGTPREEIQTWSDMAGQVALMKQRMIELEKNTEAARGKLVQYRESLGDINTNLATLPDVFTKQFKGIDPERFATGLDYVTKLKNEGLALSKLPPNELFDSITNVPTARLKTFIDQVNELDKHKFVVGSMFGVEINRTLEVIAGMPTLMAKNKDAVGSMVLALKELALIDPFGKMLQAAAEARAAYSATVVEVERLRKATEGVKGGDLVSQASTQNAASVATSFEKSVTASDSWVSNARAVSSIIESIKWPSPPGVSAPTAAAPAAPKHFGGLMRHYSSGGFVSKGTDTIPAMLSPGEYVMNARSTRRFFSQLVAMNAGGSPQYRESGGSITNVGDINLSVSSRGTEQQTARKLAVALRRELRRKTSTL